MIDPGKHSDEQLDFLTYVGGRLGEMRSMRKVRQSAIARYLRIARTSVHDIEYGYRWISAWDLKAYAELCDADIGSIYEGVSGSITHGLNPGFAKLGPEDRAIVNNMIEMLAKKAENDG